MVAFDFKAFFDAENIPYFTSGKNVKKGNVNCRCPWCGHADPSAHMGCDPENGWFGCLRNKEHKGGSPVKLVQAIKGCDWATAKKIVGEEQITVSADSLDALQERASMLGNNSPRNKIRLADFPPEFHPIDQSRIMQPYWNYLIQRGFPEEDIPAIVKRYHLCGCTKGDYAKRLIIPFFHSKNQYVGHQGRALGNNQIRYLSSNEAIKQVCWNRQHATGGHLLVVTEGALGALRTDFYCRAAKKHVINAVAVAGLSYTEAQVADVWKLAKSYYRLMILFDPGAEANAFQFAEKLSRFNPVIASLPRDLSGPDELESMEVLPFILNATK